MKPKDIYRTFKGTYGYGRWIKFHLQKKTCKRWNCHEKYAQVDEALEDLEETQLESEHVFRRYAV